MGMFQKILKADDLPAEWRREFPDPTQQVEVRVRSLGEPDEDARSRLTAVMDAISAQAAERGLTPRILHDILEDVPEDVARRPDPELDNASTIEEVIEINARRAQTRPGEPNSRT